MEEEIVLDKVWTVGTLCLSQDSPLHKKILQSAPIRKEETAREHNLIVSVLIGKDIPEAH